VAGTHWDEEAHSGFPRVTIELDRPYYGSLSATNIVGAPHMRGTDVQIIFDSEAGARIGMPVILRQLRDAGAIRGAFRDSYTGAELF
jgi:hypothetical protein